MRTYLLDIGDVCYLIGTEATPWHVLINHSLEEAFAKGHFLGLGILPMSLGRSGVAEFQIFEDVREHRPIFRYKGVFPDRVEL